MPSIRMLSIWMTWTGTTTMRENADEPRPIGLRDSDRVSG